MNETEKSGMETMTEEEVMDLLCVPAPTDELDDIEFEEDDAGEEAGFVKAWIREEYAADHDDFDDSRQTYRG
jgi:hypothetical protein